MMGNGFGGYLRVLDPIDRTAVFAGPIGIAAGFCATMCHYGFPGTIEIAALAILSLSEDIEICDLQCQVEPDFLQLIFRFLSLKLDLDRPLQRRIRRVAIDAKQQSHTD